MAKLIKISGETVDLYSTGKFALEELQSFVGGDIELIPVRFHSDGMFPMLIVNEEGRLNELPVNKTASEMTGLVVVGDVLYLTNEEWATSMED